MSASLRDYLATLERNGEYAVVTEPVDAAYDVAAALSATEAGPALRFDRVVDSAFPLVGNVVNSRERIAHALGVNLPDIGDALLRSIAEPVPPRVVDDGPCREVESPADLAALPAPQFFAKETGAYITAGVILVRDVVTGSRNMSFARFKILDDHTAMLGVSPNHHLGQMAVRASEAGQDLPIAIAIGTHPAIMLAACLYLGFGDDELECAGRLLREPVDVVRTGGSDILVPADTEVVLEGVVRPDQRVEEGLVSEFHGRYHDYGLGYVTEFTRMTHRADAQFQVIVPGLHQEHVLLGAVSIAAGLRAQLQRLVPDVVDVAVPDTGAGRTSAVVSVLSCGPGRAKQIAMACFSAVSLIKQVVVVDAEIDPWNPAAVEWARLSHARPERDLFIVPDARTDRSDPLARNLLVGKLGVDATAKEGDRAEGWDFAKVPDESATRARAILARVKVHTRQSALRQGLTF